MGLFGERVDHLSERDGPSNNRPCAADLKDPQLRRGTHKELHLWHIVAFVKPTRSAPGNKIAGSTCLLVCRLKAQALEKAADGMPRAAVVPRHDVNGGRREKGCDNGRTLMVRNTAYRLYRPKHVIVWGNKCYYANSHSGVAGIKLYSSGCESGAWPWNTSWGLC